MTAAEALPLKTGKDAIHVLAPLSLSSICPSCPCWLQCFQAVSKAQGGDRRKLRSAFEDVCARFTPVLHHFFLENFRDPGEWDHGPMWTGNFVHYLDG